MCMKGNGSNSGHDFSRHILFWEKSQYERYKKMCIFTSTSCDVAV
jgi:hypothetical protein